MTYEVYEQGVPKKIGEDFEANLKLIGTVQADSHSEAIDKGRKFTRFPVVQRKG